jgi:hypothetical protein
MPSKNQADEYNYTQTKARRDKEGHFILMKGTANQEEIPILNIYALNVGTSIFRKQTLLDIVHNYFPHSNTM